MVKGLKTNPMYLWGGVIALVAFALFYVYKRGTPFYVSKLKGEGFENATLPGMASPPPMPPAAAPPAAVAPPNASSILAGLTSGPPAVGSNASPPRNTSKNTPTPAIAPKADPKIASVKAKVAELKGMLDAM